MTHEDVVERLDGFHRGTLDEQTRLEIQTHLTGCAECRALSRTYRILRTSLSSGTDVAGEDHPASEQIVAYAEDRHRLDPQRARSIADHLAGCASCAEEVERTRRVAESIRRRPEPETPGAIPTRAESRSWSTWGALAAAAILVAVAYPAYLGLFRLPSVRQQVSNLRMETTRLETDLERLRGWGGAVSLNVLPRSLRDGADLAAVPVEPDQPYAAIVLELLMPRQVADEEVLRFEIVGPRGEVIWNLERSASRVRADIARWAVVTLIVPSERMNPGRHTLEVVRVDRPAEEPLLHVAFAVQRQSPAATNAPQ
jgi:anti-sigma factor RsiW